MNSNQTKLRKTFRMNLSKPKQSKQETNKSQHDNKNTPFCHLQAFGQSAANTAQTLAFPTKRFPRNW
jgi:hypothetical protein